MYEHELASQPKLMFKSDLQPNMDNTQKQQLIIHTIYADYCMMLFLWEKKQCMSMHENGDLKDSIN